MNIVVRINFRSKLKNLYYAVGYYSYTNRQTANRQTAQKPILNRCVFGEGIREKNKIRDSQRLNFS